jgi:WYL domain
VREIFVRAIRERRILRVHYPPGERLIEPYAIGLTSAGKVVVRVWQREGESASGDEEGLKLMRLDRFTSVEPTEIHFFGPRPEFVADDPAMKGGIIAVLSRRAA